MRTTKHLCREIIACSVMPDGFHVSGNHIFDAAQMDRATYGRTAHSVSERPDKYSARVVRAAELLASTYTR